LDHEHEKQTHRPLCTITQICTTGLFLYKTNYTTIREKPNHPTWWPHDHLTCLCKVMNLGCSG